MTALYWIKRPGEWKQFVSNGVRRTHKYTTLGSWRPVPGHLNPADLEHEALMQLNSEIVNFGGADPHF